MKSPPRPRSERLLSGPLLTRAYLFLGLMQAAAAMCAYAFVLHCGGWNYSQALAAHDPLYRQATTACLSAIVIMQIANIFLCRSPRQSLFSHGFTGNHLLLIGVTAEIAIILLIDYTPWGNAVFNTAPIDPLVWLFILPFAIAMIAIEEIRKWICRSLFPARTS